MKWMSVFIFTGLVFGQAESPGGLPVFVQPKIVQSIASKSTGSVASLTAVFANNTGVGNSVIEVCAVGSVTSAATTSDTQGLTYKTAVTGNNSTTFGVAIFYAVNTTAAADTVTCTNNGSAASIAMMIYEVQGLIQPTANYAVNLLDQSLGNSSTTNTTSPALTIIPTMANELAVAGFALGTGAQTITVAAPYNNDSGQQNPTTPAGLFSFVSASNLLSVSGIPSSPSATATTEPWAVAVASFKPQIQPTVPFLADPCAVIPKTPLAINLTANTKIVSGVSLKKIYICSIDLVAGAATNVALVEGTGSTCATNTAGVSGGTTAATGWNFAANGGLTKGNGMGSVFQQFTAGDDLCIFVSAANQVSGSINYVQQ